MTIDEAITHVREVAEKQRKDNDNCEYKSQYSCKGCADYYSKPCIECAEEHEQIAEWLEELKANRIALEKANGYLEANHRLGYNKAIDDFVNSCKEDILCQTFGLNQKNVERIAEQLKAGNINESN